MQLRSPAQKIPSEVRSVDVFDVVCEVGNICHLNRTSEDVNSFLRSLSILGKSEHMAGETVGIVFDTLYKAYMYILCTSIFFYKF